MCTKEFDVLLLFCRKYVKCSSLSLEALVWLFWPENALQKAAKTLGLLQKDVNSVYNFHRFFCLQIGLDTIEIDELPSNTHISTPFCQKTVFFSTICFGNPPSKFLELCLNSEYMWKWSPVYNFNSARAPKKLISSGVKVTSTLPNFDTQKDLLI